MRLIGLLKVHVWPVLFTFTFLLLYSFAFPFALYVPVSVLVLLCLHVLNVEASCLVFKLVLCASRRCLSPFLLSFSLFAAWSRLCAGMIVNLID
ncbi:hypothetical protein BT96DRAFT_278504 [Gymnopus androsaceus JB14]|uniref:Uncharacterized protein n=1 Tax=Gymnopus androsaceus JB14 TaxID=1447944 RepID=A0A6A4H4B4_9AGAR|nr:hypothetical protein BT96DRAFT_278504 [Gymnopus androsaceus JB14]